MITTEIYKQLRAKYDTYYATLKAQYPGVNGVTPEMAATLPPAPTNNEVSALEVYEFVTDPPDRYSAYIDEMQRTMTTWTGDILGNVSFGRAYRSNMGDKRVPITVKAINGRSYHGTYYASAGDYCRIKANKEA